MPTTSRISILLAAFALTGCAARQHSQASGAPPREVALVRFLVGQGGARIEEGGQLLVRAPEGFSAYLALTSGPHTLRVGDSSLDLVARAGQAYTLGWTGQAWMVFEDALNAHKFKAQLRAYNLASFPLNVLTSGAQVVFGGLRPGEAASRLVSPGALELWLEPAGEAPVHFEMGAARSYSVALVNGQLESAAGAWP